MRKEFLKKIDCAEEGKFVFPKNIKAGELSFIKDENGNIVQAKYGEKGSIRPDYYKEGHRVNIKNYNVTNSNGRARLVENIRKQYWQRKEFFGSGTKQTFVLDMRGQDLTRDIINELQNKIYNETETTIEIIIKKDSNI